MFDILAITFPIYAAILLGYIVVSRGWFNANDMRTLGTYVLNIALPALLFNAVATRELGSILQPAYLLTFLLAGLGTIVLTYLWFGLFAPDKSRRAVAVMGSACPNSGFIGFPVMLLVFPDLAGVILAMNFLVENMVLIPICLILMDMARDGEHTSIGKRVIAIVWGLLKRPMVIGLLLGLGVSVSGLTVPAPATRLFEMLAASAAALSLVVIGGSLVGLPSKGNRSLAVQISIGKLILHPTLTALTVFGLGVLGISLSPEMTVAVILSAAMPMFGIYAVLAQEHGLEGLASIAMLITTSAAFFSLTALLFWLV